MPIDLFPFTVKLAQLFRTPLGFDVMCKNDLTASNMYDELESYRKRNHTEFDAFACCILSHGKLGAVYGVDGMPIAISDLQGLFTGVKCQSLAGKPKIFIINACQGGSKQIGVTPVVQDGPTSDTEQIPNDCDFLTCSSTVPGYASFRTPEKGSWFIITFEAVMKKHHATVDMLNIIGMVNGYMSRCRDLQGLKQCAHAQHTLRKVLFLV